MPDIIPEQLIIRFLTNEASSEEHDALLEWISLDSKNQKTFQEYVEVWENKNIGSKTYDVSKGLLQLNHKINEIEEQESKRIRKFSWQKIAATIIFVITAGAGVWMYQRFSPVEREISYVVDATNIDEKRTIELADGSVVQMNSGSSLKYPGKFSKESREVYLTGEAFFSVKKDKTRPFIIHTKNLRTEVLGTSFNIKTHPDSIAITVATGKVKVTDGDKSAMLLPNNKATYSPSSRILKTQLVQLDRELAWLNNTIIFNDTDLASATNVLEKMYDVKITFSNSAIKKCVITGKFAGESLAHIMDAIAFSADIQYVIKNKEVIISGKGCE